MKLLAMLVLGAAFVAAQAEPRFDAVSIKPNPSGDGRMSMGVRGRVYNATNAPLRRVLAAAFDLGFEPERLVGGPAWLATDRFDLTATIPEGSDRAQLSGMLQAMFAERFRLVTHRETRDAPIYVLIVARRDGRLGAKLRKSAVDCEALAAAKQQVASAGAGGERLCGSQMDDTIMGRGQRLTVLARMLTPLAGRTVVDRTGLTGGYDFDLNLPEQNAGKRPGTESATAATDDRAGGILTAVQDDLGLHLEPSRGPLEFVVIDSVERPTAD